MPPPPLLAFLACTDGRIVYDHIRLETPFLHLPEKPECRSPLLALLSEWAMSVDLPRCRVAAWASWCYSRPSRLLYNGRLVTSAAGVQQGDNLGPLLFAAALHPLLHDVQGMQGIDLTICYLDDGCHYWGWWRCCAGCSPKTARLCGKRSLTLCFDFANKA